MKINSPPPSNGPDDKELKAFLKAMNRQMKTGKSSPGNSGRFPVPITLSADDLFHDPGEESEFMQGSVGGDAELTLSSSHEAGSIVDVLAAFPQPPIFISGLSLVGASLSWKHKPFVPSESARRRNVVRYQELKFGASDLGTISGETCSSILTFSQLSH